ncbi:hypothetical protein AJ79_02542 [Helicocarpus griseus UAMH5409]|uniref:SGNH hydrolase-type esterase domain-containing protein n=1 Tax=Helicocarpus griseus UAMH5409 TaxID=1447875 RepID=A0A2B7Y3B0_9EURO|nr:hypothetical protein AJ79_02542 [Helicocarpus griseus UAMH5409]
MTAQAKPPAFILTGDSTTAPDGGWGDGFLSTVLKNGATGVNLGDSGATTVSFIADGYWNDALTAIADAKGSHDPYVTIQFGHNDQKQDSTLDVFVANLERFINEAREAGATPLLLTSLSRRNFDTSVNSPVVKDNLANVRELTIEAADATGSAWQNLNARSQEYLNSIGPDNAHTYNWEPDDETHLNKEGGIVFGGLVADLILEAFPNLSEYVEVDAALLEALKSGEYYWPEN